MPNSGAMPKPRTSSPDDEVAGPARAAEGSAEASAGFPWTCSSLQSEKCDVIPKGAPLLGGKRSAWEQTPGGMCMDQRAAACCFHELLGRLTSEFNRILASNVQLSAENARLRAGRASPGSLSPVAAHSYAPWEAFGLKESGGAGSAVSPPCDEGGDLNPLPRLRSSPSGRKILHSERERGASSWRRGVEEEAENTDRRPMHSSGSFQQSQEVNVEPMTLTLFERQASPEVVKLDTQDSNSESQAAKREASAADCSSPKAGPYKIDDQINPKFLHQASLRSNKSELSLLPAWKKQVRNIGSIRVPNSNMPSEGSTGPAFTETSSFTRGLGFLRFNRRGSTGGWMSPSNALAKKDTLCAEDIVRSGDELRENSCLQRFVCGPSSRKAFAWDFLTFLIMCYDVVVIPLQVFPLNHEFVVVMDWLSCIIWSLDILLSFLRGADIGGVVELRPSRLAVRYLRSWFALDVVLALVDWMIIFTVTNSDMEAIRGLRIRRILRVVRIARLLRIVKLAFKGNVRDAVTSEKYMAVISIGKLLVVIWIINHYVACGWYGIGHIRRDTLSWFTNAILPEHPILYHYTTAYHWSMTQFTPASMEVTPTNVIERIYTISAIFAGLVVFSSFISNMTHAMTRFQHLTLEQQRQNERLREFLSTNRVSLILADRILLFLKSQNSTHLKKRLHERDVGCLKFLPDNLLARMREEVYGRVLVEHPLFMKLRQVEDVCFTHICNLAMSERSLLVGEELFRYGNPGTSMYFVVGGQLSYFPGYDEAVPDLVDAGEWVAECALWAKWEHRGRLVADNEVAELMCLSSAEFNRIVLQTRSVLEVQRYARIFCTRAVKDCGSQEKIKDIFGNRAMLDGITRRAFNHGNDTHTINKVMMMWDAGGGVKAINVFTAWKQITFTSTLNRKTRRQSRRLSGFRMITQSHRSSEVSQNKKDDPLQKSA